MSLVPRLNCSKYVQHHPFAHDTHFSRPLNSRRNRTMFSSSLYPLVRLPESLDVGAHPSMRSRITLMLRSTSTRLPMIPPSPMSLSGGRRRRSLPPRPLFWPSLTRLLRNAMRQSSWKAGSTVLLSAAAAKVSRIWLLVAVVPQTLKF